jgi:hypothetical protein
MPSLRKLNTPVCRQLLQVALLFRRLIMGIPGSGAVHQARCVRLQRRTERDCRRLHACRLSPVILVATRVRCLQLCHGRCADLALMQLLQRSALPVVL